MVELGRALVDLGWELVSSGGTARVLADAGLPVMATEEVTGFPEMLGHRVVTLHPAIHGGILADRTDPSHVEDMATYGVTAIDLVAVNLYPFSSEPSIELIDIGGPAMVRGAAKNHSQVTVLVDPADYAVVLDELRDRGDVSAATRRRLARDAFAHTAAYDAAIVSWFDDDGPGPSADEGPLPATLHLAATRTQELRYGENPHQVGARYSLPQGSCWDQAVQHGGKEMSYLNVYDADAAWRLVHSLGDEPTAVVIKHANACGAAVGDDITRGLCASTRGRSHLGVRRHRGGQPGRAGEHGRGVGTGVHRGRDRPRLRRRCAGGADRQEEPARAHRAGAGRAAARHPFDLGWVCWSRPRTR